MRRAFFAAICLAAFAGHAPAAELHTVTLATIPEWKAVFGQIEARDEVAARSRLGGTITRLTVSEGDRVSEGQEIGLVEDEKLLFQIDTYARQIDAQTAQLRNAQAELKRGEELFQRGVMSNQQVDALRTAVSVLENQIAALTAERQITEQRALEGAVLAPVAGLVLAVPVTEGSVILPGEVLARIGGGGFFLRLSIPERHATALAEGDEIVIEQGGGAERSGRIVRVYPEIANGRVTADVEVDGLESRFVNARVLIRLPVGERPALLVPARAVIHRRGLDFVTLRRADGSEVERTVVIGQRQRGQARDMVEVLSGLAEGDVVVIGDE